MPFRPLQGRAPQSRAPRSTPLFLEALEERQVLSVVIQGPSSSQTPYLVPTAPGLAITSIMTVGDSVNTKPDGTPYRAVGIMDGLGAYDNGNGTFSVLMNHEIPVNVNAAGVATPLGGVRAHGNGGAFVSLWTIDKATLRVIRVEDFLQNTTSVYLSNNVPGVSVHSAYLAAGTTALGRLCSADLAAATAYGWTDLTSGLFYGTRARIFQTGEEQGGIATSIVAGNAGLGESPTHFGRQWNLIVTDDPNIPGDQARTAYEMPHCGLFAWENNLANPLAQRKTIVAGMDDGNPIGQLYFWIGDKQRTGNVVERAGLTRQSTNDNLFVVRVPSLTTVDGSGVPIEDRATPLRGTFQLVKSGVNGDVSGLTFAQLEADSDSKGATQFLRPEDGQWNPRSPRDYYFVTTDRYDQDKDGIGTQVGRSRLYRMRFTDISNPELGGTIECLLDGSEAGNMFDNMTIAADGRILLQEDVGNQQHNSKVWIYDPATDGMTLLAMHDPARFGNIGVPATAPFTQDEESSGIIDVSHILGPGKFLADIQAHYPLGGELVEGGQLLLIDINAPTATLENGHLTIDGTIENDLIVVSQTGQTVNVLINTRVLPPVVVPPGTRLRIDAGQGNDLIVLSSTQMNALVTGGAGNDRIFGGMGRGVLIGGEGSDLIIGGNASDLIIGNQTALAESALLEVLARWSADTPYLARVTDLRAVLNASTVLDDTATDTLLGGGDFDWYLGTGADLIFAIPGEERN